MDRWNYYYGLLVRPEDLNNAFDEAERSDRHLVSDHRGQAGQAGGRGGQGIWGVWSGLDVRAQSPITMEVEVSSGVAYDEQGRRIAHQGPTVLDLSPYEPQAEGHVQIVHIYIGFTRLESEPRLDGFGRQVNFSKQESFVFHLAAGVAGLEPEPPEILEDYVLLAEVWIPQGSGALDGQHIRSLWWQGHRQEGGLSWHHGREQTRAVRIDSSLETWLFAGGARLETQGGDIEMEGGQLFSARSLEAQGPQTETRPFQGHLYCQGPGELGEVGNLAEIEKWASFDACSFLPDSALTHPWENQNHHWRLESSGYSPTSPDMGSLPHWRYTFFDASSVSRRLYSRNLYIPLEGLADKSLLTDLEIDVIIDRDMNDPSGAGIGGGSALLGWIVKRRHQSVTKLNAVPVQFWSEAGEQTMQIEVDGPGERIDHSRWSYLGVIKIFVDYLAVPNNPSHSMTYDNVALCSARARYLIREASGVY